MKKTTGLLAGGLLLIAGAGGGWAGHTILAPPPEVAQESRYTLVSAEPGTVGAYAQLTAGVRWESVPHGVNTAAGVVTEVLVADGDEVSACDVLYRIDERPVVIAEGDVPAYRAMASGDRGRDVSQLQQLLAECGHFISEADGIYGPQTIRAVQAWQSETGQPRTGSVELGAVVFVPALPTQVLLDSEQVSVGHSLSGGEAAFSTLADTPVFSSSLSEQQISQIDVGMTALITSAAGEFPAVITQIEFDDDTNTYNASYGPTGDEPICGEVCADFPVNEISRVDVQVEIIPAADGIVVPIAALATGADGTQVVVTASGERIPVTVTTRAQGQALVEGVRVGTQVRVPGDGDG